MNYEQSGVNVEAGEQAVNDIKLLVQKSYNQNVLSQLGSFGGLYHLDSSLASDPVLVSSTDGVGTKLRVAIKAGIYDTLGQDLVNHCVNDILVQGAKPLFFLDYIGLAKMNRDKVYQIIKGMTQACVENSCALIGGEMAEMPGIYHEDDFDLVGTIVGVVERNLILPGTRIKEHDVLIGLPSTGLHTNGYSLARAIVFEKLGLKVESYVPELGCTVAEALLAIHKSYLNDLKPFLCDPNLHALAHITGGGIPGNLKRIIPPGLSAYVSYPMSEIPALFKWLKTRGGIKDAEMRKAFNLGVGMIAIVKESSAHTILKECGGFLMGEIVSARENDPSVRFID